MREEFAQAMVALFRSNPKTVFLTADLGYLAFEELAQVLGQRFINVGIAEQNAVSVAAGLAQAGQQPWLYSMATFITMRPYAQIRDNVCLQKLPVKLVGNGGGYGYGIMGATHHCLEDVGLMRLLPQLRVFVPVVGDDIAQVIPLMAVDPSPNYLRLNRGAKLPLPPPPFAPYRRLKSGRSCVVVSMGPIIETLFAMNRPDLLDELEIWSVGTFPLEKLPADLTLSIQTKGKLLTIEEHRQPGGLNEALAQRLLCEKIAPRSFVSLHAEGYPSGLYGSQNFHQEENALRGAPLIARIEELLRAG